MDSLRFLGKRVLACFGLQITRVPQADDGHALIRGGDPVTCEYLPGIRGHAMFAVRVEDARGFYSMGLPMRPDANPFAGAALAARGCGDSAMHEVIRAELASYYGQVCPSTALEAVDLDEIEAPGLKGVLPGGSLFPWDGRTIATVLRGRETAMRLDSLQHGRIIPFSEGITAFGPVGEAKLALEVKRVGKLVTSFARSGYVFERRDPMKVVGLRRDGDYRWLIMQGTHRFAICAGFGIASVPAMVKGIIRREDWRLWPHVVSGLFTPEGALRLFDRLYDGEPPSVCAGWLAGRTKTYPKGLSLVDDPEKEVATPLAYASGRSAPGPRYAGAAAARRAPDPALRPS